MNYFMNDRLGCIKEFFESLDNIYDSEKVIDYLMEYHKNSRNYNFFIGLSEDTLLELDNAFSYENNIIMEDFRYNSGSNYMIIKRKLFDNYISLRDILEQIRDNKDMKELLYNETNENIILVDIMKSHKSNIHYSLMFDSCF